MPVVQMPDGTHVMMPDTPPAGLPAPDDSIWGKVRPYAIAAARGIPNAVGGMLSMIKDPNDGDTALSKAGDFILQKTNDILPADPRGNSWGKVAAEGATGGLVAPGGMVRNAITGTLASLGGEAGAKATNGSTIGRLAGTLAGGTAAGVGGSLVRSGSTQEQALAKAAAATLPPGSLEKAQAFQAEAAKTGVNLDLAQALDGIGVPAQSLQRIRDVLAENPNGAGVQATLNNQPSQLSPVGSVAIAGMPGQVREPGIAANNLAQAATNRINAAKAQRAAAVQSLYAQAGDLPPDVREQFAGILSDMITKPGTTEATVAAGQKALDQLRAAPSTQLPMTHALDYDTLISQLTGPYKGTPLTPADPRTLGALKNTAGQLNQTLQAASPELAAAERRFGQISQDVIDPMKQGPLGTLAGRSGYKTDVQTPVSRLNSLFANGTDPQAGSSAIRTVGQALSKTDPEAFADAAKTYYSGKLAEAFDASLTGGVGNPDAARRVVANLFANEKQWQGMKDAASIMAQNAGKNPADVVQGLENFAKIAKAASNRPSSVSGMTSSDVKSLGGKSLSGSAMKMVGVAPLKPAAAFFEGRILDQSLQTFDKILTTPEGADMLSRLAKVDPTSPAAQAIISTWNASQGQFRKPQQQQQQQQPQPQQ